LVVLGFRVSMQRGVQHEVLHGNRSLEPRHYARIF
jgi:hypothetical protein